MKTKNQGKVTQNPAGDPARPAAQPEAANPSTADRPAQAQVEDVAVAQQPPSWGNLMQRISRACEDHDMTEALALDAYVRSLSEADQKALCRQILQELRRDPSWSNRMRAMTMIMSMSETTDQEWVKLQDAVFVQAASTEGMPVE